MLGTKLRNRFRTAPSIDELYEELRVFSWQHWDGKIAEGVDTVCAIVGEPINASHIAAVITDPMTSEMARKQLLRTHEKALWAVLQERKHSA